MTKTDDMDDIDALVNSIENASVSDNKSKKKKNKKKGGQESSDIKTENSNPENGTSVETVNGEGTQNKKKKNKKKSNNEDAPTKEGSVGPSQPQKKKATVQSDPPTVPVSQLFPNGQFPIGQIMDHPVGQSDTTAKNRFNSEEARAVDRLQLDLYNEVRIFCCCLFYCCYW